MDTPMLCVSPNWAAFFVLRSLSISTRRSAEFACKRMSRPPS